MMTIRNRPYKPSKISVLFTLIFIAVGLFGTMPASAQLADEAWTEPVNLSQSGAANNPTMVVDSAGLYHVIWQDKFSGYMYTVGDGTEWSVPVAVDFPWETRVQSTDSEARPIVPQLYADPNGYVHALWTNQEDILYYSRVAVSNFKSQAAWLSRKRMAENALSVDVALDSSGRLHMVYVRAKEGQDAPAGVYYQRLSSSAGNWSLPELLYASPYFRSLSDETAHVDVETASATAGDQVYITWDNPARERVYFIRSVDGGDNWEPSVEIDKPVEGVASGGPSDILVSASGDRVFLFWQAEHTGNSCIQYYQTSADGGLTWDERRRKPEDFLDCPSRSELLEIDESQTMLVSAIDEQVYLQVWDGVKWSDSQLQDILTSFPDPETRRLVQFSCQQPLLLPGGNLLVAGCDTGDGRDIWWLKRQLVDITEWFPKEAVWNPLINVAASPQRFMTPVLIAESGEKVHAFWSQSSQLNPTGPGMSIYYARWEGRQWSQPVAILASPTGKAEQPAVAADPSGRFYAVWSGGEAGQVYFSQAISSQAVLATAWSQPELIPSPQPVSSSPDILVDRQGRIYVTYAIPLNEQRGIYVTYSDDKGETWSDPVQVFDAVGAGWSMIDSPQLALVGQSDLHILWTRYSLPSGSGSLGLYYAHSTDGGKTWLTPAAVVEKAVVWSRLIGIGDQTVHRLWQEVSSGRTTLWHEASLSNGAAWTRTSPVSIFGETVGTPSVSYDPAGQLHLFQVVRRSPSTYVLQHWRWDGATWVTERTLDLNLTASSQINTLVADASSDGNLFVVFSDTTIERQTGAEKDNIFFAYRTYDLPEAIASLVQVVPPTPLPTATATPEPASSPTPTAETAATGVALDVTPPRSGNNLVGSVLVPVAAGLIVLVAILIGIRLRRP
jgi:hypothetical protein